MEVERVCGNCTACCKTHGVFVLAKDSGTWCQHCNIGNGCQIYNERPTECQEFKCAWLNGKAGGSNYRPDKIGIVPEHRKIPGIGMTMWFWEFKEGSLTSTLTKNWTLRNLIVGNCVMHVPLAGKPKLYLPKSIDNFNLTFRMGQSGEEVEIVPFVLGMF